MATAPTKRRAPGHPYSILLPVGLACAVRVAASAVRSYRTFFTLTAIDDAAPGARSRRFLSVALSWGHPAGRYPGTVSP